MKQIITDNKTLKYSHGEMHLNLSVDRDIKKICDMIMILEKAREDLRDMLDELKEEVIINNQT